MESLYLKRYGYPGPQIKIPPRQGTKIIVVIPCYHEPDIIHALESLEKCEKPDCKVEILTVINHSENDPKSIKQFNTKTVSLLENWAKQPHRYTYHVIEALDLPKKKAGVGLARKIGMDEAVKRFEMLNEENGIIVCFDADCTCTSNYLKEIEETYRNYPNTNAALVYYEHDIDQSQNENINEAIINYELHLRYYVQALKYSRFPFAYHTVGSCITVPPSVYQKQGGMNTRKAGEDFYFLQRIFPLGKIQNINAAVVYPSSRPSDRVPFGTGRAVSEMLTNETVGYHTYHPNIFRDFRAFNETIRSLWNFQDMKEFTELMPESVSEYLKSIDFINQIHKLKNNYKNHSQFQYAIYNWFNGFKALKFVHFARDHYYPNIEVLEAVRRIIQDNRGLEIADKKQALNIMRAIDRSEQ